MQMVGQMEYTLQLGAQATVGQEAVHMEQVGKVWGRQAKVDPETNNF
ncbi:hypothetical protein PP175_12950 [Aneurinibacillus sp. Ricciae_BoGa-3]|nr:hypothetical protein [Aneurinibacillus sp. Ricciae_BoGa-3]WCK52368.1 hypothetical protein PP175_12950 [Aneurinibacillus sp. Ricciae_BoGa-3]